MRNHMRYLNHLIAALLAVAGVPVTLSAASVIQTHFPAAGAAGSSVLAGSYAFGFSMAYFAGRLRERCASLERTLIEKVELIREELKKANLAGERRGRALDEYIAAAAEMRVAEADRHGRLETTIGTHERRITRLEDERFDRLEVAV